MHTLDGSCHCGALQANMQLPRPPAEYSPRACDCDFCRKHGAAYISDPQGALRLRASSSASGRYRQGSSSAEFLICRHCGVLLAALYDNGEGLYASVNATALWPAEFAASRTVSPKNLSAEGKTARWKQAWFCQVSLEIGVESGQ
jgi:hypothetical protein